MACTPASRPPWCAAPPARRLFQTAQVVSCLVGRTTVAVLLNLRAMAEAGARLPLIGTWRCLQDKTVALTKRNTELDAKAHEAEAAGNRAALARTRVEQEKEILERQNEWLNAELARKTEAYQLERTGATSQARCLCHHHLYLW